MRATADLCTFVTVQLKFETRDKKKGSYYVYLCLDWLGL
jgi:hypothetical protein